MGLYFAGRTIQMETVLKHLLGKGIQPIAIWKDKVNANYNFENLGDRIWLWINLKTGYTIATGDEGNGWGIELAKGTREEVLAKILNLNPSRRVQSIKIKPRYHNFLEVLNSLKNEVNGGC
jgi:hypothetical protein